MRSRIAVQPFRVPEPDRSALVAQHGEQVIATLEERETRWHDFMVNGTGTEEPRGILHGSDMVAQR